MTRFWTLLLVCFVAVLSGAMAQAQVVAQPVDAFEDAAFEPFDIWFVMRMNGDKVGYLHTQMSMDEDGNIVTTSASRMAIARGGASIVIETGSTFTETADYQPIQATSRMLMATMATEQRVVFGEGDWELTTTSGGRETTQTMTPFESDWLTPAQTVSVSQTAMMRGDQTIELTTFDLSAGTEPITSTMTYQLDGVVEVFGRTVPAQLWTVETSLYPGIEMEQWSDAMGLPVRQNISLGPGMDIEILLADRALALAEFDAPEVMANTLIHPDRPINNPRRLKRAVYEISGEGLSDVDRDDVPTAGFQVVEWIDENTMRITIDLGFQTPGPGLGDDEARYLAASNALDHEDEAIAALVEQAGRAAAIADAEVDDVQAAQNCRDFVREFIDEKNLSVGFATASEVARTGEGDCTEHGCLLAAMLRGAGIPSRTVTGIVYADQFIQQNDIFGFHMWTQAWIETGEGQGVWIDLDAAFPGQINGFDATHIALSTSAQSNDDFTNDMVAMLPMMRGIQVKVVELEWDE